ncbi:DUF262 domain-containing protein [Photobacterium swingsii]|uniref:DUF262 domain-containing protein n=1 Tax=Photobacterium swingsii TaxID=680026 RepID=UPI00406826B2
MDAELFDNTNNDDTYPICDFRITTTPNDFNILTIITFIKSKVFKIPTFQRHYVWDIKRASKLIESLLIGLPIPQIFLYERAMNEFLVIDGQQRLMTLYYFVNGRFPRKDKRSELRHIFDEHGSIPDEILADDTYFQKFNLRLDGLTEGQENRFNGKNYETLGDSQMALNLATIRNMIIKPVNDDEEDGAMFEIFNRLNSGGMNLTQQEIRMSLYQSKFLVHLLSLNEHSEWRRILGKELQDLRLNDVEAILRTLAMTEYHSNYKASIYGFLNTYSNSVKTYTEDHIAFISQVWDEFMNACSNLDESDFRTGGSRMSITLFESLFYAATASSFENRNIDIRSIPASFVETLKADSRFIEYSTGKTTRKESVLGRLSRARELYEAM